MNAWLIVPLAVVIGSCTGAERFEWRPRAGLVVVTAKPSVKTCPQIEYYTVSPLRTSVGGRVALHAEASEADGGTVSVAWLATGGDVADAGASEATYTCTAAGVHELTLSVTSGTGCERTERVEVTCL